MGSRRSGFLAVLVPIDDAFAVWAKAVARRIFCGTHLNGSQGIHLIEREVTCTDILIYQVVNGQFAECCHNYDMQLLTERLGVIKA